MKPTLRNSASERVYFTACIGICLGFAILGCGLGWLTANCGLGWAGTGALCLGAAIAWISWDMGERLRKFEEEREEDEP